MVEDSQETTHFGFQTVAKEQKADMVAHVFHSVAAKYDVMRHAGGYQRLHAENGPRKAAQHRYRRQR